MIGAYVAILFQLVPAQSGASMRFEPPVYFQSGVACETFAADMIDSAAGLKLAAVCVNTATGERGKTRVTAKGEAR